MRLRVPVTVTGADLWDFDLTAAETASYDLGNSLPSLP